MIENSLDVIISILYSPGNTGLINEPILGTTRLQKLIFLLWKEGNFSTKVENLYGFQSYDFGPCMNDLYDDIDFAVEIDLIKKIETPTGDAFENIDDRNFLLEMGLQTQQNYLRVDYSLTQKGILAGKDLVDSLTKQEIGILETIKSKYNKLPLYSLIRYVYTKYPKFATKSRLIL